MSLPPAVETFLDDTIQWIYSFEPLIEPTVCLVPQIVKDQVEALSEAIGFDVPTLSITLALFACYPLGMVMNIVPYGPLRHFCSFFFGCFLLQFVVGVQWIHQLITSVIVYFMFMVFPRSFNKWAVPIFVMLYCVMGHLHRQYTNYLGWDLDFTGSQMVLTQKLYMMAYNLYDANNDSRASKKCAKFSLQSLPNILEYLGYTFCFSSVLSGPSMEFTLYKAACDGTHMYGKDGKPLGDIPSNVWPTLRPFLQSLLNLVIFVIIGGAMPVLDPIDPQKNTPVILTEEFLANPWPYRYMYQWVAFIAIRQKYYFAWKNAEGAHNVWYAGFDGFDEQGKAKGWDTACNMNMLGFELASTVQALTKEWNKKTSLWLTRYVYIRTNGNLLAVYGTSAFWHGFYPGYYMFFLSTPLLTICERLAKKKISPYFPKDKWSFPYGIACILTTSFLIEYLVSPFVMLGFDRSWAVYKSHYFVGHILPITFLLVAPMLPTPKPKDGEETKKTK